MGRSPVEASERLTVRTMAMSTVGRYELLQTIGEGGMGVVYKAFDPLLERTVAIKVISTRLDEVHDLRQRFFAEARAAGRLSHKNIVTIYDLGEENGHPYFAMELLEGRNLRMRMHSPVGMSLPRKLDIITQVCEGLAYAHARGIVHRDIKPANLFVIGSGQIKILDFGLARLPNSNVTRSRTTLGTFNYMAPEQINGEPIDHRVDIFAIGVVLYELLAERQPFKGDSVGSVLHKILKEEPEPLDKIKPQVPAALCAVVNRAIAKAREERYADLSEMLIDLAACRGDVQAADHMSPAIGIDPSAVTMAREQSDAEARTPASRASPSPEPPGAKTPAATPVPAVVPSAAVHSDASHSGADKPSSSWRMPPRRWVRIGLPVPLLAAAIAGWLLLPKTRQASPHSNTGDAGAHAPLPAPAEDAARRSAADTAKRDEVPQGTAGRQEAAVPPRVEEREPAEADTTQRAALRDELARVRAARLNAESARGPDLAPQTYAAARAAEDDGRRLSNTRKFTAASRTLVEAARLFASAETEARAAQSRIGDEERRKGLQRDQAIAARGTYAEARRRAAGAEADRLAPAAFRQAELKAAGAQAEFDRGNWSEAAQQFEAANALIVDAQRLAREAAASAAAAPPPPAPARPAESVAVADAAAAEREIREVLGRYVAAFEARSVSALKRVWPGVGGAQERAIREEFEHASSIDIGLVEPHVVVTGDTATVTCVRRYQLRTEDGRHLQTDTPTTLSLRKSGQAWIIDNVQYGRPR